MSLDDDPVEVYRREIASVSPLTKEEEAHLLQEVKQSGERGEDANRRLVENYLYLVLPIAERHSSSGLSTLELIQEGNLGLFRAVEKFSGTRVNNFSSFAAPYIEGFISDAIARSKS